MKKILMVLLMAVSLFVVSSCEKEIDETNLNNSEQKSIEFEVAYDKEGGFGFKENNGGLTMYTLGIVSSVQELEDLSNEYNNYAFDKSNESYSNELNVKIRSYDKSFFNKKSLIIYSFFTNESKETKVSNIMVDGNELTMNVQTTRKKGLFHDIAFNWIILIEINKVDVSNINDLKVVETLIDDNNSNNDEIAEILKHFDLTDTKETWDGNIEDPDIYHPNVIFVIFRKTKNHNSYPELELKHFNFSSEMKVDRLEYMNLHKPPTWAGEDFRQSAFIHLSESTAETLLEIIRHLESLEFVHQVEPGMMVHPAVDY